MPSENRSAGFVVHYYVVLQDKAQGKAAGCIVATDNEKKRAMPSEPRVAASINRHASFVIPAKTET
ncbi:TPA: hypothetical protein WLD64_002037 [Neisseria gonorrhoeae]